MKHTNKGLAVKFPVLVLLVAAVPATASAFCFSFGSKSNNHDRYSPYPPLYPAMMAPAYPGYGYGQALPAYNNYGGTYYPQPAPYDTVPPEFIRK
ncbi:MAG: hypothetical protein OEV12_09845 [Gammaproteobacteria bacterium]|jgi:hypothetical protein|nr:hypothetical protein [Gammaproteobacteria bacterium]MDH3986703.1 hypothetical protein [Gammaproteobacteria bacterium]